jgi:hypothetical protein
MLSHPDCRAFLTLIAAHHRVPGEPVVEIWAKAVVAIELVEQLEDDTRLELVDRLNPALSPQPLLREGLRFRSRQDGSRPPRIATDQGIDIVGDAAIEGRGAKGGRLHPATRPRI